MAQEMIYPLLPVFVVVALGASTTKLGAVEGALAVGVTVARLVTGRVVDRGGSPLRLTRASYALSLLARPLLALASSVGVVGALRVVDGLGKGGKDAPRDVLVAADAAAGGAGRSFGLQRMLDTLGSVAGPLVAGAALLLVGRARPAYGWCSHSRPCPRSALPSNSPGPTMLPLSPRRPARSRASYHARSGCCSGR